MKLLVKILKFIFILMTVSGVIFWSFWMVYIKKWPLWSGASLLLLLVGIAVGWYGLKKMLIRRRERQFVKQVIEEEKNVSLTSVNASSESLLSLEKHWEDSLAILKQSHLAKQGDPLYVLPWYMVIGGTGSGKTSAIRSARLPSPFPEAPRPAGSGTRFCDWWFTEHAIILDTAGKYSTPAMDASDRDEWHRLLALLYAARKKEPLNGLVVTVAADQLLEGDADVLKEEGRVIRLRIDELMKVMGATFPVYILVTKCDQIYGMELLAKNLPESFFKQPMGVINNDFTRPLNDVIALTLDSISERLKDLRFMLLDKVKGDKTGLMLLSEEVRKLQQGLENFSIGIFRSNPYQESPVMRGIFFSSAQQSGTPVSRYINHLEYAGDDRSPKNDDETQTSGENRLEPVNMGIASEIIFMDVLPGTKQGLFLYDFFDWVLTTDRWLNQPLRMAVRRFRITWSLGLIAWLAVLGGFLGLASTSYMLNRHVMNEYISEFREPAYLTSKLIDDILIMEQLRTVILKMEESNKRWWVPRFGLSQSEEAVKRLKKNYCRLFKTFFANEISNRFGENIARITPNTPGSERGSYVSFIVSLLMFLDARQEKKGLDYMKKLPQIPGGILVLIDNRITPELAQHFQNLYLYYSAWQDDYTQIAANKQKLTMALGKVLIGRSGLYDFDWILEWVNSTEADSRITLRTFWQGSGDNGDAYIEPCFTVSGKKKVDDFLSRISSVSARSVTLDEQMKRFNSDYQKQYIAAWEHFADIFPEGNRVFASNHEMYQQAAAIGIGKIPSEQFIERMVKELQPFKSDKNIPPWMKLTIEHERIYAQATEGEFIKQASGFSKLADEVATKGKNLIEDVKSQKVELPDKNKTKAMFDTVKAYSEFRKSLQDVARGITTKTSAMRLAGDMFSDGDGTPATAQSGDAGTAAKASAYTKMHENMKSFQAQMQQVGDDKIYWDLLVSPLDFFALISSRAAACSLQEQWESQVLAETSAASESSIQDILFGSQGGVWKFIKGPAAPFIKGSPQGYIPTSVLGQRIPFKPDFIDFINRGNTGRQKIKEAYTIKVKTYPFHINKEASPKPQSVLLSLSCGDGTQTVNNMNFPVNKSIKWNIKNCADTVVKIKFGSVEVERRYPGGRGFINFLSDFKSGERTFTPDDFPEHKNALKEMNVQQIRLQYLFDGHNDLLNLPEYAPLAAPPIITTCQQ